MVEAIKIEYYLLVKMLYQEIPNINGTRKLPNPPIINGITIKKIIKKECLVIIEL